METDDHKEMDMMMDMTGAVLDMTGVLIEEEELKLDELMTNLAPAMEAMDSMDTSSARVQRCSEEEEWMEDTVMEGLNFEEWVEEELLEMEVAKMVEPIDITYSEEGGLDLGLAITTPESYATPMKGVCIQKHDMWEKALNQYSE